MNGKAARPASIFPFLLFLIPLAFLLSGCTTAAKPQHYYPDADNPPWIFAGSLHGTSGEIIITVDNSVVLQGRVPSFKDALQLSGEYRGRKLNANCDMQYCNGGMLCTVSVDSKPAVLLNFSGL